MDSNMIGFDGTYLKFRGVKYIPDIPSHVRDFVIHVNNALDALAEQSGYSSTDADVKPLENGSCSICGDSDGKGYCPIHRPDVKPTAPVAESVPESIVELLDGGDKAVLIKIRDLLDNTGPAGKALFKLGDFYRRMVQSYSRGGEDMLARVEKAVYEASRQLGCLDPAAMVAEFRKRLVPAKEPTPEERAVIGSHTAILYLDGQLVFGGSVEECEKKREQLIAELKQKERQ